MWRRSEAWLVAAWLLAGPLTAHAQYAGDQACQKCHAAEARSFSKTGMARSMSIPDAAAAEFQQPAKLPGPSGYSYVSTVRNGELYHESAKGTEVVESHQVLYAMGSGQHGRSYLVARGDTLFLSPLSYYSAKGAWDLSPGYASGAFRDFTRPITAGCLFCHAGSSQPPFGALSIGCERCHGPGESHVRTASAKTIVNPAKLQGEVRDDVCFQCHLGGDMRILRRGKVEWDFRPGEPLSGVMAVFSMPASAKPEGLDAVGQAEQLRLSRCWIESQGKANADRLSCITCHDPHAQRTVSDAAFYRSRCQQCHQSNTCTGAAAERRATSPPDDCVACHMPRSQLNRIAHIAHTNHRILRFKEEALDPSQAEARGFDLIYEGRGQADARSKGLAYAQAAQGLPVFSGPALHLLAEAAKANPDDPEIAGALGLALRNPAEAEQSLERAIALGSKSPTVKSALSALLGARGEMERALQLGRAAVESAPYDASVALSLARLYLRQHDLENARTLLRRVQAFDPANPELADLLRQAGGAP